MEHSEKTPIPTDQNKDSAAGEGATKIFTADEGARPEVSAATVGRMLGLATAAELRLVEGKLDLVLTKVSTLTVRLEKLQSALAALPNGSDLERIDVQVGMIRNMLRDLATHMGSPVAADKSAASSGAEKAPPVSGAEKKPDAPRPAKHHKIFIAGSKSEPENGSSSEE
jgi:hypothetical protein